MGLWNRLTGGGLAEIDWDGKLPEKVLVYRFTRETNEIRTGSKLTVHDGWAAALICNNTVADVCPPGTYVLDAESISALLGSNARWSTSRSTFNVEVYFLSHRPWAGLSWALRNLAPSRAGSGQKVSLQGTCGFKIANPALFLSELLKPNVPFDAYPVANLRNVIAVRFGEWVKTKQLTVEDLASDGDRLIGRARSRIASDLERMGVELTEFLVAGVAGFSGYSDAKVRVIAEPPNGSAPSRSTASPESEAGDPREEDDPLSDKPAPASGPMSIRLPLADAPPDSGKLLHPNRPPAPPSERILLPDPESDLDLPHSPTTLLNGWGAGPVSGRMMIGDSLPPPLGMDKPAHAAVYHVALKGVPSGPFDLPTVKTMIRSGEITLATLIWRKGLSEWLRADSVSELSTAFNATPPPLPSV